MYGKARITLWNGKVSIFNADDEDAISDYLYEIVGESDEEELSGIPTFMEASSWCPFAGIGEVFEREKYHEEK